MKKKNVQDHKKEQPNIKQGKNQKINQVEKLEAELIKFQRLLFSLFGRFYFQDHHPDERFCGWYLKSRVTDPVDYETAEVLYEIENFLNSYYLQQDKIDSPYAQEPGDHLINSEVTNR